MEIRKTTNLTFTADASIVFICGMPGSGKSTFASKYLKAFPVIDIDDIYDETENLLNFSKKSKIEQVLSAQNFLDTLNSRLLVSIRRSLRKNPITFVIVNATDKVSRKKFISHFTGRYKNIFAIVLDISKETVIKQYKNDKYNQGMEDFLSNFDDFNAQITNESFEEFDIAYILDETMLNSITIDIT